MEVEIKRKLKKWAITNSSTWIAPPPDWLKLNFDASL